MSIQVFVFAYCLAGKSGQSGKSFTANQKKGKLTNNILENGRTLKYTRSLSLQSVGTHILGTQYRAWNVEF